MIKHYTINKAAIKKGMNMLSSFTHPHVAPNIRQNQFQSLFKDSLGSVHWTHSAGNQEATRVFWEVVIIHTTIKNKDLTVAYNCTNIKRSAVLQR